MLSCSVFCTSCHRSAIWNSWRVLRNEPAQPFWQGIAWSSFCLLTHLGRKDVSPTSFFICSSRLWLWAMAVIHEARSSSILRSSLDTLPPNKPPILSRLQASGRRSPRFQTTMATLLAMTAYRVHFGLLGVDRHYEGCICLAGRAYRSSAGRERHQPADG